MKQIKKLNKSLNYRRGMFNDKNIDTLAQVITLLLDKSDEQTDVINHLLEENENLKQKLKNSN